MPQPVKLKRLKLNSSMKTYKAFIELTTPSKPKKLKRCLFHHRGLECKSRNSAYNWSNRKIWPWSTEWSRAKANRVLPRERTGHSKPVFQQHKRRLYTWTSPDGQHQNQIGYILCSQRWRSSIQSAKTRLGADCGSDHELRNTKFRLKLKKVGKTIIPFRYDLNQIPYNYTVEVTNRFNWLDLIERLELWMKVCDIVQEAGIKTIPKKKKCKKGKIIVWGGLTSSCEKKRRERQRRKGKIYPFECKIPKNSKER